MADPVPAEVLDAMSWRDVKRIDDRGENLTQWEVDFVDSLLGYLRAGKLLTDKQRAVVDQLLEERVS